MRYKVLLLTLTILPLSVFAAIIYVPDDQPTIQAGIDAASEDDTVLVAPGTCTGVGNRNIDFGGKNVQLISKNGSEVAIIDCQASGSGPRLD